MLSKCANPTCCTTFLYLSEGRLYLVDSKAASVQHRARMESKCAADPWIHEYFWLCASCCRDMTIQINNNFEIRVVRKRGIRPDFEADFQRASAAKNISAV